MIVLKWANQVHSGLWSTTKIRSWSASNQNTDLGSLSNFFCVKFSTSNFGQILKGLMVMSYNKIIHMGR